MISERRLGGNGKRDDASVHEEYTISSLSEERIFLHRRLQD